MTTVELKPHQKKAISELDNGKILVGDVGVGKSLTAVGYYLQREAPRDVYVITTAKKRDDLDWPKEFHKLGMVGPLEGVYGSLKVDSWNNIGKYADVRDAFFIFDEQRVVGSGSWTKSFQKIAKRNRWILLSATPGDTWLDYIPVFVANNYYRNRTEFLADHVVFAPYVKFPKVQRYIGVTKLVKLRNRTLVEMPYLRHTERIITWLNVAHDAELTEEVTKRRWNPYEQAPMRDIAELFRVVRTISNSDESRIDTVRYLMERHPRLIIFYNFDYELEALRSLIGGSRSTVEANGDDRNIRTGFEKIGLVGSSTTRSEPSRSESSLCSENTSERGEKNEWLNKKNPRFDRSPGTSTTTSRSTPGTISRSSESESRSRTRTQSRRSSSTGAPSTTRATLPQSVFKKTGPKSGARPTMTSQTRDSSRPGESGSVDSSRTDEVVVAEWNGHKHEPVPSGDRWVYLVQYAAGAEGWNCVTTDAMVFYSLTYSYKMFHQAQGRIDRMNTPYSKLFYYPLVSSSWIDTAIRKSLRDKKDFNEARYAKTMG